MKSKESTRLSVDLLTDFHEEVKSMAKTRAQSLKSYVIDALTERFQKDREEEDRMWDELAEKAGKKGFASVEESEKLLNSIRNAKPSVDHGGNRAT